jgi:hypothetical protein
MSDRRRRRAAGVPPFALAVALLAAGCAGPRLAERVPSPPSARVEAEGAAREDDVAPAAEWRAPELAAAEAPPAREEGAAAEIDPEREAARVRVVDAARALVGTRFRGDCSGYVLRALRDGGVGVRLGPGVSRSESLYRASRPVEAPRPGTLAFFHDSYDRDRDRRLDDRFTHVALVERVEGTTVFLLHRARRGVERARMDLARPADPAANDLLRARRRRDPRGTRYLTGELFAAFGELLEGEFTQMLQASRAAETGERHPAAR